MALSRHHSNISPLISYSISIAFTIIHRHVATSPNLLGNRSLYTVFLAHMLRFTTVGYQKAYREILLL